MFWPTAAFTLATGEDGRLSFDGNGLPVRQPTGTFPIARTESAFRSDPNPNRIAAQDLEDVRDGLLPRRRGRGRRGGGA